MSNYPIYVFRIHLADYCIATMQRALATDSLAHRYLERKLKEGVTVHDPDKNTWTRYAPHFINYIEMRRH